MVSPRERGLLHEYRRVIAGHVVTLSTEQFADGQLQVGFALYIAPEEGAADWTTPTTLEVAIVTDRGEQLAGEPSFTEVLPLVRIGLARLVFAVYRFQLPPEHHPEAARLRVRGERTDLSLSEFLR